MAPLEFRVQLGSRVRRRLFVAVLLLNGSLAATTTAFIVLWARMDSLPLGIQRLTRYVLVQGHLATENVVAAWYSSMLLLAVAGLSILAFVADRRRGEGPLRFGWLVFGAVFLLLSLDEIGSLHERVGMLPVIANGAVGWVRLLALPILVVAAFMAAFAWIHVRKVRRAFWFTTAGVLLFLLNPMLELIEMGIVHSPDPGATGRALHDTLLVIEEAILELTGILCFAAGVCLYLARQGGETIALPITRRDARVVAWAATAALLAGALASGVVDRTLPAGDSGILGNWFPAAAWILVAAALVLATDRSGAGSGVIVIALVLSMIFGAGLYLYWGWLASRASWVAPVAGIITAALALEALLSSYLLIRSPRSSMASPALRRARPNPS